MLTAISCRALANSDLTQAAAAPLANQRDRFRTSADAWNERADMLERLGRMAAPRIARERGYPHA
jgi:hypothetical protein